MAKAKRNTDELLYEKLDTKEGEKDPLPFGQTKDKEDTDVQQVKDTEGNV